MWSAGLKNMYVYVTAITHHSVSQQTLLIIIITSSYKVWHYMRLRLGLSQKQTRYG